LIAASNVAHIDGKFPSLRVDQSGTLYLPAPPYSRIEYVAWSDIIHPKIDKADAVAEEFRETVFLDTDPSGPAIRALTAKVIKDARDDHGRAVALEVYLKGAYAYTLNPDHTEGKTPLEDFLFYSKEGYCEHFASAMVIMLRAANIPSRLATGFIQGEWNAYGGYFIVRQENAHSWVEAYIKGRGWVTFDPTPGEGLGIYAKPSALSLYIDFIRWKWNRNIIHFTLFDQVKIAAAVERNLHSYFTAIKKAFSWDKEAASKGLSIPPKTLLATVALLLIIAAAIAALRLRATARGRVVKTPWYYVEMTAILKKKGIERRPDETPVEFARRLDSHSVYELTARHDAQRYGASRLEQDELTALKNMLQEIKKTNFTRKV